MVQRLTGEVELRVYIFFYLVFSFFLRQEKYQINSQVGLEGKICYNRQSVKWVIEIGCSVLGNVCLQAEDKQLISRNRKAENAYIAAHRWAYMVTAFYKILLWFFNFFSVKQKTSFIAQKEFGERDDQV